MMTISTNLTDPAIPAIPVKVAIPATTVIRQRSNYADFIAEKTAQSSRFSLLLYMATVQVVV